ncbi:hypothetical protein PIB30_063621 [Stylosanthes scabra]|uniref:Uncharacterized protein n=1 Tax=Stylosanthes scabra TaxID=79078 RepID=A0ABU6YLS5_9FABA|nr:hypothetical protein [Stylosanthes scabra]
MVGIAEDVIVKVGGLSIPTDFHVIRTPRNNNRSNPQPTWPPIYQEESEEESVMTAKPKETSNRAVTPKLKKDQKTPIPARRSKQKKEDTKAVKKKKKPEKGRKERKIELNCTGFKNLLGKLKKIKNAIIKDGGIGVHLFEDNSKWKKTETTPLGVYTSAVPKGKGKTYGPPIRASPRLAALRAQSVANPQPETLVVPAVIAPTLSLPPKKRPIQKAAGEGTSKATA